MVFENALEILSDCLNLSESVEELSDLKIICDTSSPDEVNRYFLDKFNYNWEKECIKELEVFGFDAKEAMESNQDPVSTGIRGNEIFVHGHLGIRNDYIVFHEYNIDSLEEAFSETKNNFRILFLKVLLSRIVQMNMAVIYMQTNFCQMVG